ncbi:hypothetical protein B0T18DRAFT_322069 [Schizothecium vesticola]|uniref:F-box domain-containing protein n=1 Tax=Schizothecium vesticola TaxID=314040 RepID=A0AA40F349_9PEZI|nr:hypothetical protein B0T18DRAFT_322069 [Schizothecium vesticola]
MDPTSSKLLSRSARRRRHARPWPSPFLELPVDIILYLCRNHLPPVSTQALSLTCKSLFALVPRQAGLRLIRSDREEFLLLLEKDIGHNWYYCHSCRIMHHFSSSEFSALQSTPRPSNLPRYKCRGYNFVQIGGNLVSIGYPHVRLAMNRHFLGPPNGLPLDNFRLDDASCLGWKQAWSARILHDELFLSGTRTLWIPDMTDQALRDAVDKRYFSICRHVFTNKFARHRVKALHHPGTYPGLFAPCRNVVESCQHCLTDYDTTVKRRWTETRSGKKKGEPMKESWFITITSYHRLGGGRSPWDIKWHMFESGGFQCPNIQRDWFLYPYGGVRQMWKEAWGTAGRKLGV